MHTLCISMQCWSQIVQGHITAESPAPMLSPRALSPVKMRYCAWERWERWAQELSSAELKIVPVCERPGKPGRPVAFCLGSIWHYLTPSLSFHHHSSMFRHLRPALQSKQGTGRVPSAKPRDPSGTTDTPLNCPLSSQQLKRKSPRKLCKRIQCTVFAGALCCNDFSCYLRYLEIAPSGSKDFVHIQLEASWCFYWVSL